MINLNIAINNPLTKIIGFEAQKVNYKINKFLADKLLLKNIKLHDIALGEVEGKGRLFQSVIENGQDSFIQTLDELGNKTHDDDYQDVQIKNLDSFNLKKVKIVKIDVEGFELNVLKGAKNLISDFLPIIIFENTLNSFKYDKDVFNFLKSHNYRIFLCGFIQDEKVYINSNYFDEIKRNKLIFFELRDYNDRIAIVLKTVNLYAFSNEHISSFFQK
jgi:FkbM family methyltransferase